MKHNTVLTWFYDFFWNLAPENIIFLDFILFLYLLVNLRNNVDENFL